jgi:hypothetical protein
MMNQNVERLEAIQIPVTTMEPTAIIMPIGIIR